jgi:hypothetical protein
MTCSQTCPEQAEEIAFAKFLVHYFLTGFSIFARHFRFPRKMPILFATSAG